MAEKVVRKLNHRKIEAKWQKRWLKDSIYHPENILLAEKPFYNLWMYPYPSAEGLHAGHAYSSTGSDVYGRFVRMQGKDVFQPIGYDSFGIHSENFALSINEHPKDMLARTTKNYEKQLKSLGHGYDWTRTVTTSEKDYYKWTQWLFIQMYKAGLAYRKKAPVNWCPSCKTVLSDEQVIAGDCERCQTRVRMRELEQWFFRITDYADRLLESLAKIDWPEKIKIAQRNWIGKSTGATIHFPIAGTKKVIESFSTRPDTLYGATFFVLAPEHPIVASLLNSKFQIPSGSETLNGRRQSSKINEIRKYIVRSKKISKEDRIANKEKTGVFIGLFVVNPATGQKIPVYIADYVLMDYGTGAIMGVPAHDQRDWDFAKEHKLPIIEVISGGEVEKEAYDGSGKLVNSKNWDGFKVPEEIGKIISDVEKKGWGRRETIYHLRDWLISRQRYWGPPIPMIFCQTCAEQGKSWFTEITVKSNGILRQAQDDKAGSKSLPALSKGNYLLHQDQSDWEHPGWYPEENLPVELPYFTDYQPKGTGRGPLDDHPEFYEVKCPECGGKAKRETDVSDTFLDSSWYFLRYPSVTRESENSDNSESQRIRKSERSDKPTHRLSDTLKHRHTEYSELSGSLPWDPEVTKRWLPVDLYFGGAEHAVLHLMYSRFVTMVLYDLGFIDFEEPFPKFFAHGLVIKDGAKMSKSRGNVVNPDEYTEKFGADTLRLYLMFMGPMDGYPDFRDTGIEGMRRFVERVWGLFVDYPNSKENTSEVSRRRNTTSEVDNKIVVKMHQTIKKVTEDIEKFHYNTSISAIMEYVNLLREKAKSNGIPLQARSSQVAKSERDDKVGLKSLPTLSKTNHRSQVTNHWRDALKNLAKLIAPFAPHLAEEVWVNVLGEKFSIHKSGWPKFDPKLVKEEKVTIVIQVDGKLRATLNIEEQGSRNKDQVIKAAKAENNVQKWLKDKKLKDTIFVAGKLINFVTHPTGAKNHLNPT